MALMLAIAIIVTWALLGACAPTSTPTPVPAATPTSPPIAGIPVYIACTASMEPALTCLDLVYVKGYVGSESLRAGMVVSVKHGSGPEIFHRIIDLRPGEVLTKGDGLRHDDGWTGVDQIQAYMVGVEKNVRMHNTEMRGRVNAALRVLNHAEAAYEEIVLQHCDRSSVDQGHCRPGGAAIAEIAPAYADLRRAGCEYMTLVNEAVAFHAAETGIPAPALEEPPAVCVPLESAEPYRGGAR